MARSNGTRAVGTVRGLRRALETIHFIASRVCARPRTCPDSARVWWHEVRGLDRWSGQGGSKGDIGTGDESDGHVVPLEYKIRNEVPKNGSATAHAVGFPES